MTFTFLSYEQLAQSGIDGSRYKAFILPLSLSLSKKEDILATLEESEKRLSSHDSLYFKENLPRKEYWRMYKDFKDHAAFLDIETTGLGFDNNITLIGVYDGNVMRSFILGDDLDKFPAAIRKYKLLLTYNGTCFDLPFIQSKFPDLHLDQAHIDLRFVLRRIGLSGGLKSIEEQVGIARSEDTQGLTGWDAVRLWKEYQRGKEESLDLLIEYNNEDVMNMKTLIEQAYPRLVQTTMNPYETAAFSRRRSA
jgi:uncharacterized protein YprB with RNaseH-like and TPR domain